MEQPSPDPSVELTFHLFLNLTPNANHTVVTCCSPTPLHMKYMLLHCLLHRTYLCKYTVAGHCHFKCHHMNTVGLDKLSATWYHGTLALCVPGKTKVMNRHHSSICILFRLGFEILC